jgi:hypothetical protein
MTSDDSSILQVEAPAPKPKKPYEEKSKDEAAFMLSLPRFKR